MKTQQQLMTLAVYKWGKSSQLDMVIEECAELIDAIQKLRRNRVSREKLVEEGVDVELCLEQLKLMLDMPERWEEMRTLKLERLERLLSVRPVTGEPPLEGEKR